MDESVLHICHAVCPHLLLFFVFIFLKLDSCLGQEETNYPPRYSIAFLFLVIVIIADCHMMSHNGLLVLQQTIRTNGQAVEIFDRAMKFSRLHNQIRSQTTLYGHAKSKVGYVLKFIRGIRFGGIFWLIKQATWYIALKFLQDLISGAEICIGAVPR